jgi:antitoxin component of MazEF toxin-antitoxin module
MKKENIAIIGKDNAVEIPKHILKSIDVNIGDFVSFEVNNNEIYLKKEDSCSVNIPADLFANIIDAGVKEEEISDFLIDAVMDFLKRHK